MPIRIFYAQGLKANVLFFDLKPGAKEPWTKTVWVYDLRTNKHFTLKSKRMTHADLDEFVECYQPGDRPSRGAPHPGDVSFCEPCALSTPMASPIRVSVPESLRRV